ncbi:hypothetical protein Clacol_007738 [Clathrus columnatus]|uniref:Actin-like protein ARP6 n=1 Tax=Clathrus columnatus TaxID=1419009 RepID=A0AAV5AFR8_9AGAM|nr:hypothetical protein Clacol_007738 [Clathrus columnatus]
MSKPIIILDNGAHTIKVGLSTESVPRLVPNAAIRSKGDKQLYIGQEFDNCRDYSSLTNRFSFERGYLTDWDVQKAVWDYLFSSEGMASDFKNTSLLITEPPFNFRSIQEKYDQLVFEEYEFESYVRCPGRSNSLKQSQDEEFIPLLLATALAPYGSLFASPQHLNVPYPECSIVVDSGFSFTHVVPIMQGQILWGGVRRIDVGGKLLTNHLSNLVSFRQWNMLDQTYIVNDIKEKCCFVTSSFKDDLETCRIPGNNTTLQYVLPDVSRNRHGYIRDRSTTNPLPGSNRNPMESSDPSDLEQILYMSNERFTVPELIFNPSDIGLSQAGLHHTIADSIASLPEDIQGMFWANIGLIGGNMCFPNFENRLRQELRALAPIEYDVGLYPSQEPILETYKAARAFSNSSAYFNLAITREEYNEGGSNACRRKFRCFDWDPIKEKQLTSARPSRRDRTRGVDTAQSGEEDSEDSEVRRVAKKTLNTRKREKVIPATTKTKRDASLRK